MKRFNSLALMCMIGLLTACGGGGSDSPRESALPEGVYQGMGFHNDAEKFLTIIEGNTIWTGYLSGPNFGLIYGEGTVVDGEIIADQMIVYSTTPETGNLTGTVVDSTFSGSTTFFPILNPGNPPTLGTPHDQGFLGTTPANYNYDTPATLKTVARSWSISGGGILANTTVNDAGEFSGNSSGCAFAGTIVPHLNGKNLYEIHVTFTDEVAHACIYTGKFDGVGVVIMIGDVPTAYLMGTRNEEGKPPAGAVLTAVIPPPVIPE